jgi:glucose-1-phosphatase
MTIKAIGFDQGGILIGIDHTRIIEAFKKLGATNIEKLYTQAEQADYISEFEVGKMDAATFRKKAKVALKGLKENITDTEIDLAWNTILLDARHENFMFARSLREQGYTVFLYSNINEIHHEETKRIYKRDGAAKLLNECFDEQYYSHLFGFSKPSAESFRKLALDIERKYGIKENEILFIDDSIKHIYGREDHKDEGCLAAGWNGLLVPSNLAAKELKRLVAEELSEDF